jgi:ATP-dependent DNA helicase RecQ
VLYFGRGDIARARYFIHRIESDDERRIANAKLKEMVRLATANVCRRKQLLAYFGESLQEGACSGCDVCAGQVERVEATREAQVILSAMVRTGQRFGAVHVVDVVTGARTQKVRDFGHDRLRTYGAGRDRDKRSWRGIVDELIAQGCVVQSDDRYPVLKLSPKGYDVLFGREAFHVLARRRAPARRRRREPAARDGPAEGDRPAEGDAALFEALRALRKRLARRQNVPPYIVFSDRTLREMARRRPADENALRGVSGVGEKKLARYGPAFLDAIRSFAERPAPDAPPPPATSRPEG